MIFSSFVRLAAVALVIQMAACGGGGGGSSTIAGPVPAASSPAPTLPTTVWPFPGSGGPPAFCSYGAGATATATTVADGTTQRFTELRQPIEFPRPLGDSSTCFEHLAPNTWSTDINGFGGSRFNPVDVVAPTSTRFDSWRTVSQGYIENLDIAKPSATGLALSYTGIVLYAWRELSGGTAWLGFHAPGVRVAPVRSPLTWNGIADGLWFDGTTTRRLFGSVATVTLDQNGDSTLSMALRGHADAFGAFESAPTTSLGSFTGAGRRPPDAGGAIAMTNGYSGSYMATVYGPNAEEIGLSFVLTGPGDARAWGVIVGRR